MFNETDRTNNFLRKVHHIKRIKAVKERKPEIKAYEMQRPVRKGVDKTDVELPKITSQRYLSPEEEASNKLIFYSPQPYIRKKVHFIDQIEDRKNLAQVVSFNKDLETMESQRSSSTKRIVCSCIKNINEHSPIREVAEESNITSPNINYKKIRKIKLKPIKPKKNLPLLEQKNESKVSNSQACFIY